MGDCPGIQGAAGFCPPSSVTVPSKAPNKHLLPLVPLQPPTPRGHEGPRHARVAVHTLPILQHRPYQEARSLGSLCARPLHASRSQPARPATREHTPGPGLPAPAPARGPAPPTCSPPALDAKDMSIFCTAGLSPGCRRPSLCT